MAADQSMHIETCHCCGSGVYRWFTSYSDDRPKCEKCAVRAYSKLPRVPRIGVIPRRAGDKQALTS